MGKIVRQENPEAPFGELSRLIGLKWKTLDQDEKKVYEDRAKVKVAEATKVLEAKEKEEQKRKKESEMETESIGSDSNQAFNPSSPGQVALTYVAAPPQIAPTNHIATNARPVQSPVKAPLVGQVQQQVQVAPPPPPRPHQEIQSRTTGPFVTHPPKRSIKMRRRCMRIGPRQKWLKRQRCSRQRRRRSRSERRKRNGNRINWVRFESSVQ